MQSKRMDVRAFKVVVLNIWRGYNKMADTITLLLEPVGACLQRELPAARPSRLLMQSFKQLNVAILHHSNYNFIRLAECMARRNVDTEFDTVADLRENIKNLLRRLTTSADPTDVPQEPLFMRAAYTLLFKLGLS